MKFVAFETVYDVPIPSAALQMYEDQWETDDPFEYATPNVTPAVEKMGLTNEDLKLLLDSWQQLMGEPSGVQILDDKILVSLILLQDFLIGTDTPLFTQLVEEWSERIAQSRNLSVLRRISPTLSGVRRVLLAYFVRLLVDVAVYRSSKESVLVFMCKHGWVPVDTFVHEDKVETALTFAIRHEFSDDLCIDIIHAQPSLCAVAGTADYSLIMATERNREVVAVAMLTKGRLCDVNASDKYGRTVLMFAVAGGMVGVVKRLLLLRVNTSPRYENKTAEMWATERLEEAINDTRVDLALDPGCDVTQQIEYTNNLGQIIQLLQRKRKLPWSQ